MLSLILFFVLPVAPPVIPDYPRYVNNHRYLYGRVNASLPLRPYGKAWTAVSFAPAGTPLLYSETYFFCGDQTETLDSFAEKDVVIMYGKAAEQKISFDAPPETVVCYRLEKVLEVPDGQSRK